MAEHVYALWPKSSTPGIKPTKIYTYIFTKRQGQEFY